MKIHIPSFLLEAAESGQLNILVGAGLSMDSGLPGWEELLGLLAAQLAPTQQSSVLSLVTEGRHADAAQLLEDRLPRAEFLSCLKRALGTTVAPSPLLDSVWQLDPRLVFTTNFDSLLEASYVRCLGKPPQVAQVEHRKALLAHSPRGTIVKLHGDLGSPDSLVFSRNQYLRSMGSLVASLDVWPEFARRPCLAIGYSLRDPDLQLMCSWFSSKLDASAGPLVVITREAADHEADLLRSLPMTEVLTFPSDLSHREGIGEVLQTLGARRKVRAFAESISSGELGVLRLSRLAALAEFHDLRSHSAMLASRSRDLAPEDREIMASVYSGFAEGVHRQVKAVYSALKAPDQIREPSKWTTCRAELVDRLEAGRWGGIQRRVARDQECSLPLGPDLFALLCMIPLQNAREAGVNNKGISLNISFPKRGSNRVSVTVKDNGPGIPQPLQARILQPGVSSKGEDRGSGLFILRSVCEELGGQIHVSSRKGMGTLVRFELPVVSAGSATVVGPTGGKRRPAASVVPRFAWICEDDKVMLTLLEKILKREGWSTRAFASGQDALASLARSRKAPDLLVTDVVMPGTDGFELGEAVREKWAETRLLIASAYYTFSSAQMVLADGFLHKPFSFRDLVKELDRLFPAKA